MNRSAERTRRLFLALWPPDELRRAIEHETRHAARHSGGRVISRENLHITLVFLGSVPNARLSDVVACIHATAIQPFELILGELKWWQRQELLCLEPLAGVDALNELVERLRAALRSKSFEVEHRTFRPHLTLARDVRRDHESKPIRELHWQVERIELVESQTLPSGAVYSVLPT
jgi:2'-5' RNA ligase